MDEATLARMPLVLVAFAMGAALAAQVGCNSELRARAGHPLPAAIISFAIGTVILLAVWFIRRPAGQAGPGSLWTAPWWAWLGGALGAAYVFTAAAYASRLGAAAWLGTVVTGQILTSLALDHFGLIGFAPHPMNVWRIAGACLLLIGVALVLRF